MRPLLLALLLLLSACAATPPPPRYNYPLPPADAAIRHNQSVCAEQGRTFDPSLWRCVP